MLMGLAVSVFLTLNGCSEDDDDSDYIPIEGAGTLIFNANGEGFVHDGFKSEDGWNIEFDHVFVNIEGSTAYQVAEDSSKAARHAGHPHSDIPEGAAHIALSGQYFLDLKQTGDNPVFEVGRIENAPIGNYNYLNFNIVQIPDDASGDAADYTGYSLILIGVATYGDPVTENINFSIKLEEELTFYNCGPLLDLDEDGTNDGVLAAGGEAKTEMTFHFDHIFGDWGETGDDPEPTDSEEINFWGIGFNPFYTMLPGSDFDIDGNPDGGLNGSFVITETNMKDGGDGLAPMPNADYFQLTATLNTLGHTGEGHCLCRDVE